MIASVKTLTLAAAALLLLAPLTAAAQAGRTELTGRVTDSSGAALPGVVVTLSSPQAPGPLTAVTDGTGQYRFQDLRTDTYSVTFELPGFETRTNASVALLPGSVFILDRQLELAALEETVEVLGEVPKPPPPPVVRPPLRPRAAVQPVPAEALASVCGPAQPTDMESPTLGHIAGHRDAPDRTMYGTGDVLVLDAGAIHGIAAGDNYVVRRRFRIGDKGLPLKQASFGEQTAGLVQVVEADAETSIAVVVYACGEFLAGDAIEPFDALPVWTAREAGTPRYDEPARIIFGDEGQDTAGPRQLMVIDWGAVHGLQRGQRVTIFRRSLGEHGPVSTIADAVIVAVQAESATIRIERANDAVTVGDMVALHR